MPVYSSSYYESYCPKISHLQQLNVLVTPNMDINNISAEDFERIKKSKIYRYIVTKGAIRFSLSNYIEDEYFYLLSTKALILMSKIIARSSIQMVDITIDANYGDAAIEVAKVLSQSNAMHTVEINCASKHHKAINNIFVERGREVLLTLSAEGSYVLNDSGEAAYKDPSHNIKKEEISDDDDGGTPDPGSQCQAGSGWLMNIMKDLPMAIGIVGVENVLDMGLHLVMALLGSSVPAPE